MNKVMNRITKMDNELAKRLLYDLAMKCANIDKSDCEFMAGIENVHPIEYYAIRYFDTAEEIWGRRANNEQDKA